MTLRVQLFKLTLMVAEMLQKYQEMPHMLTIAVREITNACICNLKMISNIDVQQDYLSKKD